MRATDVVRVDVTLEVGRRYGVNRRLRGGCARPDRLAAGRHLPDEREHHRPPAELLRRPVAREFAYRLTPASPAIPGRPTSTAPPPPPRTCCSTAPASAPIAAATSANPRFPWKPSRSSRFRPAACRAEFGRMQAGIFNFIMKSGSNQIHGSVYGALRNEALNANTGSTTSAASSARMTASRTPPVRLAVPFTSPRSTTARTRPSSTSPTSATASAPAATARRTAPCRSRTSTTATSAACSERGCRHGRPRTIR